MYYQSDYILRMIEMMGNFWRRIMGMMEDQQYEQAEKLLDDMLVHNVGLNREALLSLSMGTLITTLSDQQRAYASEALWLQAEIEEWFVNVEEAQALRKRAFALLRTVWQDDTGWAESRYPQVKSWIAQAGCDDMLWAARFCECAKRFGEAEDALWQALRQGDIAAKEWGVAFYRRLMRLPQSTLTRGGLPMEEVKSGFEAFVREPL